jgi:hypothetical protein
MSDAVPKRPVVLIVEDEFLLRMDAVDMVRNAGFEASDPASHRSTHGVRYQFW